MDQRLMDWIGLTPAAGNYKLFLLQGSAGSGKTETIKDLIASGRLGRHAVLAPTNKAVKVLRARGVAAAQTIHSLCFKSVPNGRSRTILTPLLDPATLKPMRAAGGGIVLKQQSEPLYDYTFSESAIQKRINGDETSRQPVILIIDEASMIAAPIWRHLLRTESCRVLAVGDVNQLPPIESELDTLRRKMEYEPDAGVAAELTELELYENLFQTLNGDIVLTTNYRQASGNTIIEIANEVLTKGTYKDRTDANVRTIIGDFRQQIKVLAVADIVLGWRNKTVDALNQIIRNDRFARDFAAMPVADRVYPLLGDILYVTSRYALGQQVLLAKGEMVTILDAPILDLANGVAVCKVEKDDGSVIDVCLSLGFCGRPHKKGIRVLNATYGYALTVHKFQGSQAPHVVVVDEIFMSDRPRWLYTAFSRASGQLTIIRGH